MSTSSTREPPRERTLPWAKSKLEETPGSKLGSVMMGQGLVYEFTSFRVNQALFGPRPRRADGLMVRARSGGRMLADPRRAGGPGRAHGRPFRHRSVRLLGPHQGVKGPRCAGRTSWRDPGACRSSWTNSPIRCTSTRASALRRAGRAALAALEEGYAAARAGWPCPCLGRRPRWHASFDLYLVAPPVRPCKRADFPSPTPSWTRCRATRCSILARARLVRACTHVALAEPRC